MRLLLSALLLVFIDYSPAEDRPNILLIVADDMGYSDLGCYGAEFDTPHLDQLAGEGTRLANFRVNPMCVVSRTSLMTGQTHTQSDHYKRSLPLSKALEEAGYATSISGKWHQPRHPLDHGFQRFYGFLGGQINNFTGSGSIVRQREPEEVPADWFATDAFTDHTIKSIDVASAQGKPFFAYLAFNAPHTPLNVSRELVEKYEGRFDEGWNQLREKRFQRLRQLGLIDERHINSPPTPDVRPWHELPKETQEHEAFRMQVYAAVIDNLDTNVGRLLAHLDKKGLRENTLVIFLSDNGGDYGNGHIKVDRSVIPWERNSIPYLSNGWASLRCAPFRFYKSSCYEGGVRVPFIMRWPKGLKHDPGLISFQQAHITDLYPTFLQLAGTTYEPAPPQVPIIGRSLLPLFEDSRRPSTDTEHPVFWSFSDTSRGYLDYPWKIVSINEGPWALYNLKRDPVEAIDLASSNPQQLAKLAKSWLDFAESETKIPPSWRTPLRTEKHGWGYHRLTKIWPFDTSVPLCSEGDVPLQTPLTLAFKQPLDFTNTKGKTIRLYRIQDPTTPVWTADPEPNHPAQGALSITFDNLPKLQPDTSYFLLSDTGFARINQKPLEGLNDGARWFRFRTTSSLEK
ncbi:sulfatase-like hydrolase/transferase [Roseibacillus persicicus]|uniref:sulfatase-like hydrolase/transferase n=1 Tax=Roseibacillus persicicus TaxID=454148 RepID=UPI00398B9ECF